MRLDVCCVLWIRDGFDEDEVLKESRNKTARVESNMRLACSDRVSDQMRRTENVEDRKDHQSDATHPSL